MIQQLCDLGLPNSKLFINFYYNFKAKYEEYCTDTGWFNSITHGAPIVHSTMGAVNINEKLYFWRTYLMKLIQRFELKR